MKDRKVITIFIVLGIIFTILGGSLAYWSWSSTNAQKTNVTFTVGSTFSCSANGGGNITNTNYLVPTECDNATYAIKKEITVNTTSQNANEIINLDMNLSVDSISYELLETDYFMYALTKNANSCNGAISGGSFKDNYDYENKSVPLLIDEEFVGTESKTYYLYIWLDKDETDPSTMNTSFSASIDGSCTDSGNVLRKVYANLGGESSYYKASGYKDNITSISFVNEINIPDNATNWNVGVNPSNVDDAKAWLEDDGLGNNTFALKIGANGTIFANSLSYAFYELSNVSNFNASGLDTSETTNMHNMFYWTGDKATTFNLNLGNHFDTSNVTDMAFMFAYAGHDATSFNLNLGNHFNTSKVTYMQFMFMYVGMNTPTFDLNLGNHFDTSNVNNMAGMFLRTGFNATDFNFNLGNNFNTANVTNMVNMFSWFGRNASTFNLNLGNHFDTSNVINMQDMFQCAGRNAPNFNLNLGNQFNISHLSSVRNMFSSAGNNAATNFILDLSASDFISVSNIFNMFNNFGNNKATIYVKDADAQDWIISRNSIWGTSFSASNVLIK